MSTRKPQERNLLNRKAYRDAIVEGVGYGMSLTAAAKAAGVCDRTANRWYSAGRDEVERNPDETRKSKKSPQRKFYEAHEEAVNNLQKRLLMQMQVHNAKSSKATAFLLERRFPNEWGRRETLKVEGDAENPIEVTLSKDLDAAITEAINAKRKKKDGS